MRPFASILMMALLLLTAVVPAVGAGDPEGEYRQARTAYHALQNSARKQMFRDQWQKVLDGFTAIYEQYPDARRADDALYMTGKTTTGLYRISRVRADAVRAVEIFRELARRYPDSNLADDGLLQAGSLLEESLNDPEMAWRIYRQMRDEFPAGDMAGQAERRLRRLAAYAPAKLPERPKPASRIPSDGGPTRLTDLRFWSNPGYTRIVLDLSAQSNFTSNFLPADAKEGAPPRLYLDLEPAELGSGLDQPRIVDDGLLQQIRTGRPQPGTVRVVLDLESVSDYKIFPLGDPYRIVVDIAGDGSGSAAAPRPVDKPAELRALPADEKADDIARVLESSPGKEATLHIPEAASTMGLRRIVVDAGHGGRDPGAIGPGGTYEKHVTLALAKRLKKKLETELGCEVILTRDRDVFLPLEERTAIANKVGADLFISLHANATESHKPYGIETYYLNFSKNDKAAALAARENGTSLKQVSDLELILFDLMANAKINESSRLAAEIQKGLVSGLSRSYGQIKDLGVRQGPFYVLLGATMPSVLIETAFISNPREEKRLISGTYQNHTVDAIAQAVRRYAINNKLMASR
ncbi:MAG TPA: N-acetylmuramoyl-L-alanine amidase [Desulfuromonadales bacterium]|nr:N-acetylmuramoyl-L-alanine amidase [Desulfuromonadales bacterium]